MTETELKQETQQERERGITITHVGKQETLEEDLKFPIIIENGLDYLNLTTKIFNNGAKWQQERMYSEEEVLVLLHKREDYENSEDNIFDYQSIKKWFEQFKKK
jgi:hypothetical protein